MKQFRFDGTMFQIPNSLFEIEQSRKDCRALDGIPLLRTTTKPSQKLNAPACIHAFIQFIHSLRQEQRRGAPGLEVRMAFACAKSRVVRLEKSVRPVRCPRTSLTGHRGCVRSSDSTSWTCSTRSCVVGAHIDETALRRVLVAGYQHTITSPVVAHVDT